VRRSPTSSRAPASPLGEQEPVSFPTEDSGLVHAGLYGTGLGDKPRLPADFCDIAEELLRRADQFLRAAKKAQPTLSSVKRGPVSLNPADFPR
jgi:hypothetical protein